MHGHAKHLLQPHLDAGASIVVVTVVIFFAIFAVQAVRQSVLDRRAAGLVMA